MGPQAGRMEEPTEGRLAQLVRAPALQAEIKISRYGGVAIHDNTARVQALTCFSRALKACRLGGWING
jgi:hypothetical protein